jgi:molybdate transport system ATP-binding protein
MAATGRSAVTLRANVRVEYDDFVLDVTVHVAAGEVVAILGPNGAGKTTLLRALAGLRPLSSGRVELDGEVLDSSEAGRRVPPQERRIGMVFQDYRLFPHLSACENVAFGPRSTGTAKAQARADATDWLGRLGLAGVEGRRPAELSGGQAQRVALARALCTQPELLLLDEPLAALDVSARADVRTELQTQLAQFAGATVLVTHEPLDALSLADRLVILESGRITQDATPVDIVRRPATPYIARLVGLNLVRGTAHAGVLDMEGGAQLVVAEASLEGPALAVARPSAVLLQRSRPTDSTARNVFPGRIASLETFGDRVRVNLDSDPPMVADITAAAVAELRLVQGDRLWISLKATDLDAYPDVARPTRLPGSGRL